MIFCQKKEIKPLLKYFIFVITFADTQPSEKEVKKVKNEVIKNIEELYRANNLSDVKIKNRVVLTGINKDLEMDIYNLDDFKRAFTNTFVEQREKIRQEREQKDLPEIAKEMVNILEFKKDNFNLTNDELDKKKQEIEADIEALHNFKNAQNKKLSNLEKSIKTKLEYYEQIIKDIDPETIDETLSDFLQDMSKLVEGIINQYYDDIENEKINIPIQGLKTKLLNTLKYTDLGTTIITGVVFAWVSGIGVTATGNIVEALIAGILRKFPKLEKANVLLNVIHSISDLFDKINPFEYLGRFVSNKIISAQIGKFMSEIAQSLPENTIENIRMYLDENVFAEYENELQEKKNALKDIREKADDDFSKRRKYLISLEEDLKFIKKYL